MATAEQTSSHKDTGETCKLGHNNPDEAAKLNPTNLNPNMATAEPTSSHKDTGDASKLGHNNPDEAAHFLKDTTQLTDRFMESISSFNRYAQEDLCIQTT